MKSSRVKLLSAALGILGLVSLAGCSSSPKASTTTTAKNHATTRPVTPSLPKTVPNKPNLRRYVSVQKCAAIQGGWQASGVATNPGSSSATYLLTVYFTDTSATVIGFAQTHVKVAAGKSSSWMASSQFRTSGRTLCVLSGVG
jgi:hypothetical protein